MSADGGMFHFAISYLHFLAHRQQVQETAQADTGEPLNQLFAVCARATGVQAEYIYLITV